MVDGSGIAFRRRHRVRTPIAEAHNTNHACAVHLRVAGWISASLCIVLTAGAPAPARAQSTMRVTVDAPVQAATVTVPFVVSGWALDLASNDSGVDAVHVWAAPYIGATLGTPMFLGAATINLKRPDVARVFGDQYGNTGFHLVVPRSMPAGPYLLGVFARQTSTQSFSAVDCGHHRRATELWASR
jgi:hypothetical protein